MSGPRSTHLSLERAIAILRAFSEAEPKLSVAEISRRLDIHKSTVSRILATLQAEGLVWQDETTGRFGLGLGLVEFAGVALGQIDVRAAAIPHMERLATAVDETIALSVRRGTEAVTVAHVDGTQSIRHVVWIGRRIPVKGTATGRALTAETAPDSVVTEVDEYETGTSEIAAPVQDTAGRVVAALSIAGPSDRFGPVRRADAAVHLLDAARAIAWELGVRPEVPV